MLTKPLISLSAALTLVAVGSARATPVLTTLATFSAAVGTNPTGGLVVDPAGDVFGTAQSGFTGSAVYGSVFEYVAPSAPATAGTLVALHTFTNGTDGGSPIGGLVADAAGDLYGGTTVGGSATGTSGNGTLFEYSAAKTFGTVVTLTGSGGAYAGRNVTGTLSVDAAGNVYGTTVLAGSGYAGTVFSLSADHSTFTTLAGIGTGNVGSYPNTGVTAVGGNLYGTTQGTIDSNTGQLYGNVFKLSGSTLTNLVTFSSTTTGSMPAGNFATDAAGNLYGETSSGNGNAGTVYELTAASGYATLKYLATFDAGGGSGAAPRGGLLIDSAGNLFGTTSSGGANGDGTVFELQNASSGYAAAVTLLASLGDSGTGSRSALVADAAGNLYGTTYGGPNSTSGSDPGTLFEVTGSGFVAAPEPSSLILAAVAGAGLLGRRRRR